MTREEQLFNEALALPPADRAAFLARACAGDDALHRRLSELLDAYASSGDFLAASVLPPPPAAIEEKPGDVLGRYTLVSKLGEGGCGAVYLAEQHEPVRRQVALKVIKLGMDTREVIARFEAERQALALMDHPGIARVYDAGATAAGRPFFVMEFVDGVPITQFCDTHQLPVPERLGLFADLCLALQHAHQKGIIHRDLKPSNILVTLVDGAPTPKIIDFGIAKATQGKLTAHTLVTRLEQMIGTPVYMSPEQADLRDTDIDTRSDIYSLGVLLYELLTGRPPFDPHSLLQAGVAEIRRIIRETDPPRPSTAVATLADADRTTVAQRRRASPARLPSALSGDLDWIVMRCLEKQRDRRYGTAEELGRDIRRHLQHEPVSARPPSALYRARKFISRHRLACASAAALALAIVAGATVSTWQAIRATRAEHAARLAQADAQRRQAEAEDLLGFMLGDFRAELKRLGRLNLLNTVGKKAESYYTALDPRDQSDTALARYAKALSQIGEIRMDEARYDDAETAFRSANRRVTALVVRHPRDANMLFERAQTEYWVGFVARRRGDSPSALEWFSRYRDSALQLVQLEGKTSRALSEMAYGHHNLAVCRFDQDDVPAAREGFLAERDAVSELSNQQPTDLSLKGRLAEVFSWLGSVAERNGDYNAANLAFSDQLQILESLRQAEPEQVYWRERLAEALSLSGDIRVTTGKLDEAAACYARARAVAAELAGLDPSNRRWDHANLKFCLKLAELDVVQGRGAKAAGLLRTVREKLSALVQAEPTSVVFAATLAKAWRISAALSLESRSPDAVDEVAHSLLLGNKLIQNGRADRNALGEYAQACILAGRIEAGRSQPDLARAHFEEALHALTPAWSTAREWQILDPATQALTLLGRSPEARSIAEFLHAAGYVAREQFAASLLERAHSKRTTTQN